jgi:hypothetical protein
MPPFDVNPGRNMLAQSMMGQGAMPIGGAAPPPPTAPPGMGGMPPGLGTPGMGGGMGTPLPMQNPMGGTPPTPGMAPPSPMAQAQPRPLGMFDPGRNALQQQSPMGGMFAPRR